MWRRAWLPLACGILLLSNSAAIVRASDSKAATAAIEKEVAALSEQSGGQVGVAAWRLDGVGPRVLLSAQEAFPMASTFKIAVAAAVLAAVDTGQLKLDQMVDVDAEMMVPSEVLADRFIHPGVSLSLHNLLELMLTQSDNTATDVVMKVAGGATAVTAWIRRQGVQGQRVDRDTAGLLRDFFNLPGGPLGQTWAAAVNANPSLEEAGAMPNPAFDDDLRDTSTPAAMSELLTRIFNGKALSASSTEVLIGIMERCRTGEGRLKGRLPAGTSVAHKTGTLGGTVNDVGVITLPDARGKIVISVFIKKSHSSFEQREAAIAEIARSVRDYFLLSF